jgi:uncharacterized protein YjbI with pentapeptide repeats
MTNNRIFLILFVVFILIFTDYSIEVFGNEPKDKDSEPWKNKFFFKHNNLLYHHKKETARKNQYGLNGKIWSGGKEVDFSLTENYDFTIFSGYFYYGDSGSVQAKWVHGYSFFAADFSKCRFEYVDFSGCDFRYADFYGADFTRCIILKDCNLSRAEINNAQLAITPEQLQTTNQFTEDNCGDNYIDNPDSLSKQPDKIKQRILLERLWLTTENSPPPSHTLSGYWEKKDMVLKNIDFNKFNNGKKTPLPCIIRDCQFNYSFENCSFTGGELERVIFLGIPLYNHKIKHKDHKDMQYEIGMKIENCDFSRTRIKDVDFGGVSLKGSNFEDAEIEGVNFAGGIDFYNTHTQYVKNGRSNPWANKNAIALLISDGLQKEQLQRTASFKKKILLANKYCTDLNGLDFSCFNLTGCKFAGNLTNVNFTNAVVTDCVFGEYTNLTLEQIKSTWNYKNNRMTGIMLPPEIQKSLDAKK